MLGPSGGFQPPFRRMAERRLRTTLLLALASLVAVLSWACSTPTTSLTPPLIEKAGLVASVWEESDNVRYVFADGVEVAFSTKDRRLLTGTPGGKLVILGVDAVGKFAGAYLPQDGLPADCYVDASDGVDRGEFIELRGVLWRKAASFSQAELVPHDTPYPRLTRFCFDVTGEISETIASGPGDGTPQAPTPPPSTAPAPV